MQPYETVSLLSTVAKEDHPRGGLSVWYGIGAEGIEEEFVLIFSQYSCTINQYWKD
jgi:hypothetical protein